jgi:RNA polymerase sigma-70 factor (ECF subfamily)
MGNVCDSEDLAQETLVKAFNKIQTLRDSGQFVTWASQIARNLCRDLLRSRKLHRQLLEENQDKLVQPRDEYPELRRALEALPEEHRLPLMLYYFDGQKTDSIAMALNLSQAGACTRLCRARKALRKRLEER